MDGKDTLKSMLNNLINNKETEASLDLHSYLSSKLKTVTGLDSQAPSQESEYSQHKSSGENRTYTYDDLMKMYPVAAE